MLLNPGWLFPILLSHTDHSSTHNHWLPEPQEQLGYGYERLGFMCPCFLLKNGNQGFPGKNPQGFLPFKYICTLTSSHEYSLGFSEQFSIKWVKSHDLKLLKHFSTEKMKEISESTSRMFHSGIFLAHFEKGAPHYPQKAEANIETGHWVCRLAIAFLKRRCVVCGEKMGLHNEGKDAV